MIVFFIGLILGGCLGVIFMALCICAGESDRRTEEVQRSQYANNDKH